MAHGKPPSTVVMTNSTSINPVQNSVPCRRPATDDADKAMIQYQRYVNELQWRFPDTYRTLKKFLDRGNCSCIKQQTDRKFPYQLTPSGAICTCLSEGPAECCKCTNLGAICLCSNPRKCQCTLRMSKCQSRQLEHTVRVYDVHEDQETWGKFLKVHEFDAAIDKSNDLSRGGFKELRELLFSDDFPNPKAGEDEYDPEKKVGKISHLITVSHLSANVAKLLGGKFNIPADFFNRHLPGTEPISGRLISRLPSSVQIDFEELYESTETFKTLFPWLDPEDGHQVIDSMMRQNLLFGDIGWDYFPVSQVDFDESVDHSRLSSGFETLSHERPKNVFQFTLTHRISVYSNPPGHPDTAIVLLYPRLPVCNNEDHYKSKLGHRKHRVSNDTECLWVNFRSIPDSIPDMLSTTYHDEPAKPPAKEYKLMSHKDMKGVAYFEGLYKNGDRGNKTDYASAFDRELEMHLWEHMRRRGPWRPPKTLDDLLASVLPGSDAHTAHAAAAGKHKVEMPAHIDDATFVHLFGAPLFKVVAANWARLVARRSFDLDLLEWRPAERMGRSGRGQDTVEAIKSRRVAIGSHYRDIDASVEVLSGLTQEERPITLLNRFPKSLEKIDRSSLLKLALFETNSQWNRGRSNGFVAGLADKDSWEKVYYDFFELRASVAALSRRADKIQDGIIGLIGVWSGEQSENLNMIAICFTAILLPFSVSGTIFGANITRQQSSTDGGYLPPKNWKNFAGAVGGTLGALLVLLLLIKGFIRAEPRWITPARRHLAKKMTLPWHKTRGSTLTPSAHDYGARYINGNHRNLSVLKRHGRNAVDPHPDVENGTNVVAATNGVRNTT